MKRLLLFSIFTLLFAVNAHAGKSDNPIGVSPTPELIPFKVAEVYIPEGFDDNDNLQVVIEGFFPNGCYKVAPASIEIKSGTFKIQANAYRYYGFCVQMVVPFQQVVDLGIHASNIYDLHAVGLPALKKINVKSSSNPGPDDFMYAPVKQIYVSRNQENPAKRRVLLSGEFSLSCLKVARVDVAVNDNVLVVLPVAEIDSSTECTDGIFPFEVSQDLPDLPDGRYLVHVRTLNGTSINRVILLGNVPII
jgi:hypothetical protein